MKTKHKREDWGLPPWLLALDAEDMALIRSFVLSSGSLKELAAMYEISYPTIRQKLNRLIDKIQIAEQQDAQGLPALIKELAVQEALSPQVARVLLSAYEAERQGR